MSIESNRVTAALLGLVGLATGGCVVGFADGDENEEEVEVLDCSANRVEDEVVTNWSQASQSFQLGAVDRVPLGRQQANGCFYEYGPSFVPGLEQYITNSYSRTPVDRATAEATLADLCTSSGNVAFRLIGPAGDVASRLEDAPGRVQIVHGMVIEGSFVTILLPPNWRRDAAPGTYPVLFQGFYDVNENLFGGFGEGRLLARLIAQSGAAGRTGAIGVLWNGGASVGSVTANPGARRQFASVIDAVADHVGADRHRIILFGESRGGVTTLAMASNPDGYDYTVTFAVAVVPGVKLGTHARLISATMPGQVGMNFPSTGFADAWLPGWRYPVCGRPELVGLSAQQALSQIMLGSADFAAVDALNSPISDPFVAGLSRSGTELLLQFGSHDEFIPFATELEYLARLRAAGVPVEAHIVIRGGHTPMPGIFEGRVAEALRSYVEPGASPALRTVAAGSVRYHRVDRATAGLEEFAPPDGQTPFTLEVPRRLYAGMPMVVMATGEPGTTFQIATSRGVLSGTVGGSYLGEQVVDTTGLAGTITYSAVTIQKPGGVSKTIDLGLTPSPAGRTLVTEVLPGPMPAMSSTDLWRSVLQNTEWVGGWGGVNWGVSEY